MMKKSFLGVYCMSVSFAELGGGDEMDTKWQNDATCAQTDPGVFFPEVGESARVAKEICVGSCAVREQCLDFALNNNERFGVWGGLSELERRKLKKKLQ
jgi:WhiB family redox-sensing transcriptional regulator